MTDYFNLSFLPRLGLALLSGSLPTFLPYSENNLIDMYFLPYSVSLALLVLIPFIHAKAYRVTRCTILISAAVANLAFASWLVEPLGRWLDALYDVDLSILAIVLPVLSSTLIISVVTALVARIEITVRYIVIACIAGSVAGIVFPYLVLDMGICWFDCTWRNSLYFMGGWMIWHTAIFITVYSGTNRIAPIQARPRPSASAENLRSRISRSEQ